MIQSPNATPSSSSQALIIRRLRSSSIRIMSSLVRSFPGAAGSHGDAEDAPLPVIIEEGTPASSVNIAGRLGRRVSPQVSPTAGYVTTIGDGRDCRRRAIPTGRSTSTGEM